MARDFMGPPKKQQIVNSNWQSAKAKPNHKATKEMKDREKS